MEELKGVHCEHCGKEFKEEDQKKDNVVYCAVCGAPVHRSCWEEKGGCPFEGKHSEGFVYQFPEKKYTVDTAVPPSMENTANANTGNMPYNGQQGKYGSGEQYDEYEDDDDDPIEELKRLIEGRNGEKDSREKTEADFAEKKYDGVSEREMMCFLNVDGPQKLYRLAMIKYMIVNNKKAGFNLFSGLLNPYNQFYKGMTFLGVLLTLFNHIMAMPQLIVYYMTFFKEKTEEAVSTINESALLSASSMLWFIQLTMITLLSIFGDYLYIAFMIKKIKKIRAHFQNEQSEEYLTALVQAGRPRIGMVVFSFGLQIVLILITLIIFTGLGV